MLLRHVPRDDQQDAGERRQRNKARERRRQEQEQEHEDSRQHPGDRPGHAGRNRRSTRMIAIVVAATATAVMLIVSRAAASACSFGTNALGSRPGRLRPSRSLIWLAAMMMAMPAVKPTVTGKGMNLM